MPSSSFPSTSRAPTPTMGKAIKGLFSRAKSPDGNDQTARTRLRSLIGEKRSRPSTSGGHGGARDIVGQRTLTKEPDEKRLRPPTPDFGKQTKRNIRFAPSALPALQKGEDGKWQPPSLSRGSLSTSALALYAQGEDVQMEDISADASKDTGKERKGNALMGMFGSSFARNREEDRTVKGPGHVRDRTARPGEETVRPERATAARASPKVDASPKGGQTSRSPRPAPLILEKPIVPPPTSPISPPPLGGRQPARVLSTTSVTLLPAKSIETSRRVRSPTAPPSTSSRLIHASPPAIHPTHSRANSEPLLSTDHYALRLSTSYLLKCLTPIIRGSSFVQNDKNIEMRRLVDERLSQLERLERGWGGEWGKIAAGAFEAVGEGLEGRVRAVQVGERTKERERRMWKEAVRDGVLLCFLFNHLFPSQPARIPRVNISEDGILRATNITRVIAACQAIELPVETTFSLLDLQDGNEAGLGRVAGTILALARKSGRTNPGRSPTQGLSRTTSRDTSRAASPAPMLSPPRSPRRGSVSPQAPSINPSRRGSDDRRPSVDVPVPTERRSMDIANDLHTKLQAIVAPASNAVPNPDITPPSSGFVKPTVLVTPTRPQALSRSTTQPAGSPLRPRSPPGTPARSGTPTQRSARPMLRPRNTTGSRVQVSFANDPPLTPTSTRTSFDRPPSMSSGAYGQPQGMPGQGHGRERTPSLISSGSRVTSGYSGYTRSSAAFSVSTLVGDDHTHAIDLAEEDDDGSLGRTVRNWERRASEKTLHEARKKILGTLLSSEDLPADLKVEVAAAHMLAYLQPGFQNDTRAYTPPSMDELRGEAITRSLEALEGVRSPPTSLTNSPSRRVVPRRAYSSEVERVQVNRLSEEDELSTSPTGSMLSGLAKPSIIRRSSTNGKVLVPKRSASPTTHAPSASNSSKTPSITPTSTSFPFPAHPGAIEAARPRMRESQSYLDRPTRLDRRQSEIAPPSSSIYGAGVQNGRVSSMVNLPSSGATSLYREGSIQSAIRSGPLQVLEFEEPGMPVVRYQLGNCIGRGQFGSVYRSLNLGTGQMAAIKRIRLYGMKEDQVRDVMREVELLKRLSHPSIVKYEGMSRDDDYLNIVLEFVENGSLGQTLKAFGNFNERLVSSYVAKILEGLDYLHSQGVVHCDLKAANILSTKNGNVKLSDFGVSLNMKAVENIKHDAETRGRLGGSMVSGLPGGKADVAGTPNWMAPEVISLNGASPASDIWSLGCTVIELLTGRPPYAEITNSMTVLFRIVEDEMPPLPIGSPEMEDFLKLCFIKDPSLRPSAALLFDHPWVRSLNPQLQLLRPQDSVPFLRRVSMNSGRTNSTALFANDNLRDNRRNSALLSVADTNVDLSPAARDRLSVASSIEGHGKEGSDEGRRGHAFIKTSFGQAIVCRICHLNVKRVGVVCQACGLISHSACATASASRCDAQQQYARQQEYLQSTPSSRYVSPQPNVDILSPGADGKSNFPGRILQGIKRSSTAALRSTSSIDDVRRRKSSLNSSTASTSARPNLVPRSNTTDERNSSRQSRMSVVSNASMASANTDTAEGITEDGRRRSAIRFDDEQEDGKALQGNVHGVGRPAGAASPVFKPGQYPQPMAVVAPVAQSSGKKDKSDCVVQ